MSSSSDRSYSPEPTDSAYSPEKLFEVLFTKLFPISGDKMVHDLLRVIYRAKPECIQATGGIHNSDDGKETYQAAKVWIAKDYYQTLHINGIMRGKMLKVTHLSLKSRDAIYRVDFRRPDGGGGGGGSRYAPDKCPW